MSSYSLHVKLPQPTAQRLTPVNLNVGRTEKFLGYVHVRLLGLVLNYTPKLFAFIIKLTVLFGE